LASSILSPSLALLDTIVITKIDRPEMLKRIRVFCGPLMADGQLAAELRKCALDVKERGLQTGSPIGPLIATVPKGVKQPLKFYVKAADNVSSVNTKRARRRQQ